MSEEKNISKEELQEKQSIKQNKLSPKKILIGGSIILATFVGIYSYYLYSKVFPTTDNAYVDANVINVSAKVGGYVDDVFVKNNQFVHKGDKLIQIDPKDYNLQVAQAKANLETVNGNLEVAKTNLIKAKTDLNLATKMAKRYQALYKSGAGSQQDSQKYSNQQKQAQKTMEQAAIQADIAKAQVDAANVALENANLNLSYTTLSAPADGFVSNLKIYKGQLIAPGQPLFGFIDNSKWWVNANFKETELDRIREGQKVKISLDMYNHTYTGYVDSISFATGAVFSLLPPENATGNWVKVTQRFPVKIALKDSEKYPLRVGASAEVKVNTLSKGNTDEK